MSKRPHASTCTLSRDISSRTSQIGQGIPGTATGREILPELLTTKEAAKLLSIGERTLWRWSRSGICPAPITIGSGLRPAVRYRRAELLAWLDSGCPRVDGRV